MSAEDDIKRERDVELRASHYLARKNGWLIHPKQDGRDKEKDIQMLKQETKNVEFKHDYASAKTGNLYFEVYNCRLSEPSGLKATTSDIWAYIVPTVGMITFNPKEMLVHLREQVVLKNPQYQHKKGCGDNNSDGVVVPLSEVVKLPFVEVDRGFLD